MGLSVSKAVLGATTDELKDPEPKHLANLLQYINGTNMSVEHMADVLSKQTQSSSWVVVFKALITVHHLMVHGNERFIKHLASRSSLFTLHNFFDGSVLEGFTMSAFIRRYSKYLNEKSLACRLIAFDVTKTKRGVDGMMRTLKTKELLDILPVIQTQFDALLNFNADAEEVTNEIICAAFKILYKDSVRLFVAYNEGIINLLDKYFDMTKNQCKESLGIYTRFLRRKNKLAQFLNVAEQIGIDTNGSPYIPQAPHGLLSALKCHLQSLSSSGVYHRSRDLLSLQHTLIPTVANPPVVTAAAGDGCFSDCFSTYDLVQTMLPSQALEPVRSREQQEKMIRENLNDFVTNHLPNLNFGEVPSNRSYPKWSEPSEAENHGATSWQQTTSTSSPTFWNSISVTPFPHLVPTPTGTPLMTPQSLICSQMHFRNSDFSTASHRYETDDDEEDMERLEISYNSGGTLEYYLYYDDDWFGASSMPSM